MDGASLLDTPRQSPQLTHALNSPARSVHPEIAMGPLHSTGNFGHPESLSFFHDDISDGDSISQVESNRVDEGVGIAIDGTRRTSSRKRRSGNYLGGTTEQFHSYCGPQSYGIQKDEHESHDGSVAGSVDELHTPSHNRRKAHVSRLHIDKDHLRRQRSHSPVANEKDGESPVLGKPSTKADQILGLHALSLKALERLGDDTEGAPISPTAVDHRVSKFVAADSRPRYRSSSAPAKKVSMVPPPISTSNHPLPDNLITTPYPFMHFRRKDFGQSPSTPSTAVPLGAHSSDSILTLSIQRSNPNSRIRISTLTIPANSDFSTAIRSGNSSAKEKHFAGLDFDDMELFRQLNTQYRNHLGAYRLFAARSLSQIVVTGTASRAADAGYGWLHGPRSPRLLASKGLSDTFSEDKLMRHFGNPKLGKARYAWVSWAHRLAAAPAASPAPAPLQLQLPPLVVDNTPVSAGTAGSRAEARNSMIRRAENHEGLEFVVSWSAKRIVSVLVLVLLLSVAAALLWTFLGPDSSNGLGGVLTDGGGGGVGDGSYRHAGDRVGTGVVIGICVLLIGLTGMGGWIGVSWLIL